MSDTANKEVMFDLDASIDDLPDLPGFVSFPTGAYRVQLVKGLEPKKIGTHPAIEMAMTLVEILECDPNKLDEHEELPKSGDIATVSFMLDNEYGAGNLKAVLTPFKNAYHLTTPREVIEHSKGAELGVVIKRRKGKKGTDKENTNYMSVEQISLV